MSEGVGRVDRISSALLTVVFFAALAGPRTASAIWIGSETSEYESVGGIATAYGYYASGTLIADRWVLTAAHVADQFEPASPSYFAYGDDFLRISSAYVHPDADSIFDYDIGLFELEAPISDALFPTLFNGDFVGTAALGYLGAEATLVGYGANDPFNFTGEGERRAGNNSISYVDDSYLGFWARNGAGGLPGDSGGSTWADFGLGEVLIGVHSFVVPDGAGLYDTYDVRIDRFRSWIDSTVGAGVVQWGNGMAVVSVPEPSPLSLLAIGCMAIALMRRHRRRHS